MLAGKWGESLMDASMPERGKTQRFNNAIASVSSAPIAAIGLALAVYLYEVHRMTSLVVSANGSFSDSTLGLVPVATLVIAALVVERQTTFRLHRHTAACFAIAGVFAITLLWTFGAIDLPHGPRWDVIVSVAMRSCETLLLLCWGETLLLLTARQAAAVVATGLVTLGAFNAFSVMLKTDSAGIVVALLPLFSMACLYWFKDRANAMEEDLGGRGAGPAVHTLDRSLIPGKHRAGRVIAMLNFLLPLLCFPVVFGFIHYAWVPSQDGGTVSTFIQLSAAVGTMLGGGVLYLLVSVFWGRRRLALYNMFTLLFTTLAFALVGFASSGMPYAYIVVLNIAQKIAFFFIWMAPFLIDTKHSPVVTWCVALGLYQLGKFISNLSRTGLGDSLYMTVVVAFMVVLIMGTVLGIVLDQGEREWIAGDGRQGDNGGFQDADTTSTEADKPGAADAAGTNEPAASQANEADDVASACAVLAERYHLSRREEDVLLLLAQGMVARDVAETLVISNSTAKTHMRNLYAKMDVHSQTELVLMISQAR